MRALVIGADGFAGRWLVRHLLESGDAVCGVVGPSFSRPLKGAEQTTQLDVRDALAMARAVQEAQPDAVYYLAGVSRQGARDDVPAALGVSVVGSMNALIACAHLATKPRLLFVSTGYVYRAGPDPLDEESPVEPDSVYPRAKLVAERGLLALGPDAGVDILIARPFNHIGPGQADSFLVPTLARQVAAAANGGDPQITVADASVVRDFSDVRDVVRAYRLITDRGEPGATYNIGSGVASSVADLARELARLAHLQLQVTSTNPEASVTPGAVVSDPHKVKAVGWHPQWTLTATLAEILTRYQREGG